MNKQRERSFAKSAQDDGRKGSVLIVALWTLLFFTAMTLALAARTQSQISVIKRFVASERSAAAGVSGVSYVLSYLEENSKQPEGAISKTPLISSFFLDNPKFFQKIISSGSGFVSVGYLKGSDWVYGLSSEDKININLSSQTILKNLYIHQGVGEEQATEMSRATVEWRTRTEEFLEFGNVVGENGSGFGSVEELLLVPGMTASIWNGLKDHLTVFGEGKVNLNTVPKETLVILGISDDLAERIVQHREEFFKNKANSGQDEPFKDFGDLTLKIGVSSEEIAQLSNVSELWEFKSTTFHFWAFEEKEPFSTQGMLECVVTQKGRILFLKEV